MALSYILHVGSSLSFVLLLTGLGPATAAPPLTVAITSCTSTSATITGFVGNYPGGAPGNMRQFLGIPYAKPPVGALRWQPPKPNCWHGNRASFTLQNPICPQGDGSYSTEDCLYLNVFTQATGNLSKRPVMVFIHGGGFTGGAARNEGHNPVNLVNDGVVVVSVNYRLGAFGFLAHPALDSVAAKKTGMYALLDQQLALKWVQQNIAAFGGNPANVTIFGQSAGGMSVMLHMISPPSQGLFHKAIIQSGTVYNYPTPLSTAESQGVTFAESVGCPGTGAATANCLRALPDKTILAKQWSLGANAELLRVDGVLLTDTIRNLFAAGNFRPVPVINGSTRDEMREHLVGDNRFGTGSKCNFTSSITPATYRQALSYFWTGSVQDAIVARYPAGSAALTANANFSAARGDIVFHCTALRMDNWLAAKTKVYAYEFNDPKAPNTVGGPVKLPDGKNFPLGAYHGAEMQYLFPEGQTVAFGCAIPYSGLSAPQRLLAKTMTTYWTTFAKTGNPNPANDTTVPLWPSFSADHSSMMSLRPGTQTMTAAEFDLVHNCSNFWNTWLP